MIERGKKGLRSRPTLNPKLGNLLIAALAAATLGYGAYGVWRNDLDVPMVGTLGRFHNFAQHDHFHGASAWLAFLGLASFGVGLTIFLLRRLETKPPLKIDRGPALPLCVAGVIIVTAMQILDGLGLV